MLHMNTENDSIISDDFDYNMNTDFEIEDNDNTEVDDTNKYEIQIEEHPKIFSMWVGIERLDMASHGNKYMSRQSNHLLMKEKSKINK